MTTIAHISDLHCSKSQHGKTGFKPDKLGSCILEINKLKPDIVIVTGDLTMFAFEEEYIMANNYLSKFKADTFIIPGNHDSRYRGYEYFEDFFGFGNKTINLPDVSIIGIDTTIPDLNEGNVGRGKLRWLLAELNKIPNSNRKIVAMHHHLIAVPHTGRERSTVADCGNVLDTLVNADVDMVLCGHRHTPYCWLINNLAIVNAGSISSKKLRAKINNSYNIIDIDNLEIKVYLKEIGKKRKLMAEYIKEKSQKCVYIKSSN
jgi:3',5'-cyclic AMP phosphodiesterase CpdA